MSEEQVSISSPARRVVKAKAPPPASASVPKSTTPGDCVLDEDSSGAVGYPLASPSVERQLEIERSEKWRKDRLDAAAAKHKLQRDRDLRGRRQNGTVQTTAIERTLTERAEIPKAFSVEPQYPEHKRSGDVVVSEEPFGKRRKASMDEGPEDDDEDRTGRATNVMYVTAALAAAVAIGVAIFRRFGRG